MARPVYGARTTCESCYSMDVRRWHREGRLRSGQYFSWSWTRDGKPVGSVSVQTATDAVVLIYRCSSRGTNERELVEQRVPLTWTACHLGGQRPWFVCWACGHRAAVLYLAGERFSCRRCAGLAYASQQQTPRDRGIGQAQKIRLRLGGSANLCERFPEKPKRMHWRTYRRLRSLHDAAEATAAVGLTRLLDRWEDRMCAGGPEWK